MHHKRVVCTVQIRQDRRQVFFRVTRVLHQILRPGLRKKKNDGRLRARESARVVAITKMIMDGKSTGRAQGERKHVRVKRSGQGEDRTCVPHVIFCAMNTAAAPI
jgi:hypothetical protein